MLFCNMSPFNAKPHPLLCCLVAVFVSACVQFDAAYANKKIRLGCTTSIENSGLLRILSTQFTNQTGIHIRAIVQGSGAILGMGSRGDLDAFITHQPQGEAQFKAEGLASWQKPIMYNAFVLVGPKQDPANIQTSKHAAEALQRIARAKARFISRGDKSGTHQKELELWNLLPVQPVFSPTWYKQTGQGMSATLNVALGLNAYLLIDNATWAAFPRKGRLQVLYTRDARFHNVYTLSLVSPKVFSHVKHQLAQTFARWLTSAKGRQAIASFKINQESVFTPIQ